MTDIKIFADSIEETAQQQIKTLSEQETFQNEKIRIMPDTHAGKGCVIGFTSTMSDKVIPNVIGVDIGCGMRVAELGKVNIDLPRLDAYIKSEIPAGMNIGTEVDSDGLAIIEQLFCIDNLRNRDWLNRSLCSLGGGNHFIEVDEDADSLYLIIHSGSRNLGSQVASYYQKLAVKKIKGKTVAEEEEVKATIALLKSRGEQIKIPESIEAIRKKYRESNVTPDELCYLVGQDLKDYMHDMRLCQQFAVLNRKKMCDKILKHLGLQDVNVWECIHNYIDEYNIIRKGAISAHAGQPVIIPLNMRDGCIIGTGKGNADWNESAPHGAGRIMSRAEARRNLTVDEFTSAMDGIYTTTANASTIDESPMAYKPMEEILKFIGETVEIKKIIKPIYNFKAGEE